MYETTYYEPRLDQPIRERERRVQQIAYDQIDDVRNRELAIVTGGVGFDRPSGDTTQYALTPYRGVDTHDDRVIQTISRSRRRRLTPSPRRWNEDQYERRPRRQRRRSTSDDADDADSGSSRERSSRRSRRDRSPSSDDNASRLWYSMKKRKDGNFVERNLDSSYDGLIAGLAGAAIGAMTARRFGGEDNRLTKEIGGAVAGAAAFNVGENWFRVFTEEREERKERKEKKEQNRRERRE